jgi:hypothetical protein
MLQCVCKCACQRIFGCRMPLFFIYIFFHTISTFTCSYIHSVSRPRMYEHLGRNQGIIYWQIRHPVTIKMCTVVLLNLKCEDEILILITAPAFPCLHNTVHLFLNIRRGPSPFLHCCRLSKRAAKTQYRKFETNIPRKGISRPQSQFPHSCICERFIYSHDRSAYSAAGTNVDRSWEYRVRK